MINVFKKGKIMNFITFDKLNECIYKNISKIPKDVDLIVGIPRSGTFVANLIALYLNLPFTDIDNFLNGGNLRTGNTRKCSNWIKNISEAKKVLIVDDSISSGKAIREVKNQIKNVHLEEKCTYLAIYALEVNINMVDIFFEICHQPRMFEWNYMHHWGLKYACVDIDGVLCEDPSFIQNDDNNRYRDFLKNAKPKFIPTQTIGYIVTCRLEKYRKETEEWLKKYNIQYDHLIMLELESGKERLSGFNHGQYKANVYKRTNCFIFIESNFEQAVEICNIAQKQVFCVDKKQLINPQNIFAYTKILANDWKITTKRVIKKILKKI